MTDKVRVPLRYAIDCEASPVVTADDDLVHADRFGDAGDGVGVGFEAEVGEVRGTARVAVAHTVEGDAAEA